MPCPYLDEAEAAVSNRSRYLCRCPGRSLDATYMTPEEFRKLCAHEGYGSCQYFAAATSLETITEDPLAAVATPIVIASRTKSTNSVKER